MDLSNGFTIAEILTRKYPNLLSIYTYYNAQSKDKKENNWEQIKKCTFNHIHLTSDGDLFHI